MDRNPLLYSDHSEVEAFDTIEPIENKRSFAFYFIVLINFILVLLVLFAIWLFLSKSPDMSIDQQLKTVTQQFFNALDKDQQPTIAKPDTQQASINEKPQEAIEKQNQLEALKAEQEALAKEAALKAEQERLEALAIKLQEEKDKASALQASIDEAKQNTSPEQIDTTETKNNIVEEPSVLPNAAKDIPDEPINNAQTQMEKILETMQSQQQ